MQRGDGEDTQSVEGALGGARYLSQHSLNTVGEQNSQAVQIFIIADQNSDKCGIFLYLTSKHAEISLQVIRSKLFMLFYFSGNDL